MNENCLRDLECPNCGHSDTFEMYGTVNAVVHDDGTDDFWGFDATNGVVSCPYCHLSGPYDVFDANVAPLEVEDAIDFARVCFATLSPKRVVRESIGQVVFTSPTHVSDDMREEMVSDPQSHLVDLLTNLRHFCHSGFSPDGLDFDAAVRISADHYRAESK